jgi:hypothetical protein
MSCADVAASRTQADQAHRNRGILSVFGESRHCWRLCQPAARPASSNGADGAQLGEGRRVETETLTNTASVSARATAGALTASSGVRENTIGTTLAPGISAAKVV